MKRRSAEWFRQVWDSTKLREPLRVMVNFTDHDDLDALCEALRRLAQEITPANYDAIIRSLLDQYQFELSDGWMKPGIAKSDLTPAETSRVMAIIEALRTREWELASSWQKMFDSGFALSPFLRADKPGGVGPIHLDYFAHTDFFEVTTEDGQFRLRIFPGDDVTAIIAGLDELKKSLDPQWEPQMNALCRSPMLSESAEGWRVL